MLVLGPDGTPDFLWTVNLSAMLVTTWKKARDQKLARVIRHIDHTEKLQTVTATLSGRAGGGARGQQLGGLGLLRSQ